MATVHPNKVYPLIKVKCANLYKEDEVITLLVWWGEKDTNVLKTNEKERLYLKVLHTVLKHTGLPVNYISARAPAQACANKAQKTSQQLSLFAVGGNTSSINAYNFESFANKKSFVIPVSFVALRSVQ